MLSFAMDRVFPLACSSQFLFKADEPLLEIGTMVRSVVRSNNLTLGFDPTNDASYANQQDAMALASMAINQDVRLHANAALRSRAQRHLGDARDTICIGGQALPVTRVKQKRNGELVIALDEPTTGDDSDIDVIRDPQRYVQRDGPPFVVATGNPRSRQNGLSDEPVDDQTKLTGGLQSASMNKNRNANVFETPAFALPRGARAAAAVSRTAAPQVSNGGWANVLDLTTSPVQANALSFPSTSASALLRLVIRRLAQRMRTDGPSHVLFRAIRRDAVYWTQNIEIWLDLQDSPPTDEPGDEALEDLVSFLMRANEPSPAK
jgi:hypothetical protein